MLLIEDIMEIPSRFQNLGGHQNLPDARIFYLFISKNGKKITSQKMKIQLLLIATKLQEKISDMLLKQLKTKSYIKNM